MSTNCEVPYYVIFSVLMFLNGGLIWPLLTAIFGSKLVMQRRTEEWLEMIN